MMIKQTVLLVVVLFGSLFPIHTIMQPPFNANYIEADLVAEVKVTKGKSPSVPEVLKKHHFNICWEIQVQNVIKGDSVIGKKLLLVDKIRSFESYQLDDGGTYIVLLSEPMDADIDVNLQKKNTYMCLVGGAFSLLPLDKRTNKVFIDSSYFFNDNSRTVDLRMMNNKNYYLDYSTLLDAAKRLDTNATRINNMNVIKSHRKARRIHEGDARATDSVNNYFNKLYVYPSSKK